MPYKDKALEKISKYKRINARKELLSQFPCRACGDPDYTVIQWHHVDPETKEFDLFQTSWATERFWNEVLKCVPLCANCHIKIHKDLLCLLPQSL